MKGENMSINDGKFTISSTEGELFELKKQSVKINFEDTILVLNSVLASLGYYGVESISILADSSGGVLTYNSKQ